jgi:hypothetical protein
LYVGTYCRLSEIVFLSEADVWRGQLLGGKQIQISVNMNKENAKEIFGSEILERILQSFYWYMLSALTLYGNVKPYSNM